LISKHWIVGCLVSLVLCAHLGAQDKKSVHWLTFEQLDDSLEANPKKVFIDFYTSWCTYCRKMDKVVFTKRDVVDLLNGEYYAVRFDAESESEVYFDGSIFINDQIGSSRNPIHQIAQLLALRDGKFTAPTLIVAEKDLTVTARYFEYMDSDRLLKALK
jgi:thioredoxin-related protein